MSDVHATAVIGKGARLGERVKIGPFCIVGDNVELGDDVELMAHVVLDGRTEIGPRTKIHPFASLGQPPQHLKYAGEPSRLVVGADCIIREYVTMSPGTAFGGMETVVGDNCYFMVSTHVAHDCHIGNHVLFTNGATIAGHCHIGDYVILSGFAGLHQWVRIGKYAFVGGMTGVENDVIPFGSVLGNRAVLGGLNIVGLKRHGFDREDIHTLRQAYRLLFSNEGTLMERVEDVAAMFPEHPLVMDIVDFIRADSDRSLCTPRTGRGG
jgi:UDP-N-acetylglucosamine acyltransferase